MILLLFVSVCLLSYVTKPSNDSFNDEFKKYLKNDKNYNKSVLGDILLHITVNTMDTTIKDYILFKVAFIKLIDDNYCRSIGILQHWIVIDKFDYFYI